jgi:DNA-binding IclR family transcriptional regulator
VPLNGTLSETSHAERVTIQGVTTALGGPQIGHTPQEGTAASIRSVLERVFLIFDCLGDTKGALSLSELARRTGLPKSTVYRLTRSLVDLGAVEKADGQLRLGLRLFEIGGQVPRWQTIREAALPFMQDLFVTTRQTIHLGILDGGYVVYLEKIRGHDAMPLISRCGGRLPAHCTGLGKALLAFAPSDVQETVLNGPLLRRTRHTITVANVLRAELEETTRRGYAVDREEVTLGVQCVAAPVLDTRGYAVAALSVAVPTSRSDVESLAPAVSTAARGLSRVW